MRNLIPSCLTLLAALTLAGCGGSETLTFGLQVVVEGDDGTTLGGLCAVAGDVANGDGSAAMTLDTAEVVWLKVLDDVGADTSELRVYAQPAGEAETSLFDRTYDTAFGNEGGSESQRVEWNGVGYKLVITGLPASTSHCPDWPQ
jgi:hypothetical protein